MADDRSVIDRLDDIESMLQKMNVNKANSTQTIDSNQDRTNLVRFIKTSKKEHYWWGTEKMYANSKKIAYICFICLIIIGIISSVLSSIACKVYSTFTFIENIWLIFAILMLTHTISWKKRILDFDLMEHHNCKFIQNEDGTFVCTNQEKKRYRWTRRISYLAVLANIICAWMSTGGIIAILATIFELAFLGLTIGSYFAYINLSCMYGNFVFFTNRKIESNELATIVYDGIKKRLISMEEFNNTYNNIND